MRYINTKTRGVLDTPCVIYGGDWVEYGKENVKKDESLTKEESVEVKNTKKDESLTKEQIMNELDALGIEYDKKAKKEDLYKLMMGD